MEKYCVVQMSADRGGINIRVLHHSLTKDAAREKINYEREHSKEFFKGCYWVEWKLVLCTDEGTEVSLFTTERRNGTTYSIRTTYLCN